MTARFSRTDEARRVYFRVERNGRLVTGIASIDFSVNVRNPADTLTMPIPSVTESGKPGVYYFDMNTGFMGTHGVGAYGGAIEVDSTSPFARTTVQVEVNVTQEDIDTIADGSAGTFDRSNDTLEDIRDAVAAGSAPSVAAIVAGVWGEPLPGAFGAGTAGAILGTNLDALVSSRAAPGDAMTLTTAERDAIVDAVWDEAAAAHSVVGSFGEEVKVKLTPTQATQLLEVFRILGLDPTAPLIVSKTSRTAGGTITQTVEENVPVAGSVRVTRL